MSVLMQILDELRKIRVLLAIMRDERNGIYRSPGPEASKWSEYP